MAELILALVRESFLVIASCLVAAFTLFIGVTLCVALFAADLRRAQRAHRILQDLLAALTRRSRR